MRESSQVGEMRDFNPRSHKGSDDAGKLPGRRDADFNPRSHKGSDRRYSTPWVCKMEFQSTLPQGERRPFLPAGDANIRDFNPRSHKGSDKMDEHGKYNFNISIHAPTRGATR